ncbi:MAG: ATP-binding protein [Firmicutes bacterium]|nr:ATP-binding protein [Bacillota bacterium]
MRELSLHILDIARNSIEAGADEIEIRVRENTGEDNLRFSVIDNGPGIKRELLPVITDPFFTTKEKKKPVGLGLSLLKAAAERCDGGITINSEPGKGTEVTASFRHSHIDRMPLGDLPSTITVLITMPGLKGLRYDHEVNGRCFTFSLQELDELSGGPPAKWPVALRLLRDYLEEGILRLYGGGNHEIPRRTGKPA